MNHDDDLQKAADLLRLMAQTIVCIGTKRTPSSSDHLHRLSRHVLEVAQALDLEATVAGAATALTRH